MNLLQTWHAFITGINQHWLLARLIFASIELTILAVSVALFLRSIRPRTPRLVVFLWALVLAKPLLTLVIGSPLHIIQLAVPAPEAIVAVAPATAVDTRISDDPLGNARGPRELPIHELQNPSDAQRHLDSHPTDDLVLQSPTASGSKWWHWSPVFWLWLVGVVGMLIRGIQIRYQLSRILAESHVPSRTVTDLYSNLISSMKIRKPPQLLVTSDLESPALVRLWQTTILVPAWLVVLPDQSPLSWSLRHELMHAKHGDLWLIQLRQLARAVFFFHPLAWKAGRRLEEALEIACDRAVITSDAEAADYAKRLYQILDAVRHHHRRPVSSGLFATRSQIAKRLLTLLEAPMRLRPTLSRFSVLSLTLLATFVLLVGIGLRKARTEDAQLYPFGTDFVITRAGGAEAYLTEELLEPLSKVKGVKQVVYGLVDVADIGKNGSPVILNGWPAASPSFAQLTLLEGVSLKDGDMQKIMIGHGLATDLGKKIGDDLELYKMYRFRIVGIYKSTNKFLNNGAVLPLKELQRLSNHREGVRGFVITAQRPIDEQGREELRQRLEAVQLGLHVTLIPQNKQVPSNKPVAEIQKGSHAESDSRSSDSGQGESNSSENKTIDTQSSESKHEVTTPSTDDVSHPTPSERAQVPTEIQDVAADKPKISGIVSTLDGQPISGALVSIYSAGVRVGTSPYCPTCYTDCGKRTTADKDGAFAIERLDPTLIFNVLVVAKGFEPQFVNKVDPLESKHLAVVLKARPTLPVDRRQIVMGQVVGPNGKPLPGAIVEPYGCKSEARRWWGSLPGIDPLAVTDEDGNFEIISEKPIEGLDLQISARATASKKFALVATGLDSKQFQLSAGATVRGRLLEHNQAVSGVLVGLVQANRTPEKFTGPQQIGTDADGRFLFANVSSDEDYFVYGLMSGLSKRGAVGARRVHVAGDQTLTDVGDLSVEPAYGIRGRLVLSDGKPLPKDTRVLFSRGDAWDSQTVPTNSYGHFAVQGIPHGIISITASVPGYRVSDKNKSLEPLNGFSIQGLVSGDINELIVLFEPGKRQIPEWPTSPIEQRALTRSLERLKVEPPVGVTADLQAPPESDPVVSESPVITRKPLPKIDIPAPQPGLPPIDADVPQQSLIGRVTDLAEKPVVGAEVWLPLRWVSAEKYLTAHAKCGDDGQFKFTFPAAWVSDDRTQIVSTVWAYAPGHSIGTGKAVAQLRGQKPDEPCEIHLGPPTETQFTVLLPDGKPAAGLQVQPHHYLGSSAYEYVPPAIVAMTAATTDIDGHAALPAFASEKLLNVIVVSDDLGTQQFALHQEPHDADNELNLLPVGRIEGRVLAEQKELFHDSVISVETENDPTGRPINCTGEALLTVDQDGRFVIPHIAAGWIELYADIDPRLPVRPRLPDRRQFEVIPGKTTHIDIPLELAVRAHGVVRVKGSEEPVPATNLSIAYGVGRQSDRAISDEAGRYSAYVLPGNVRMQTIYIPQGGLTQLLESRSESHSVPEGVTDIELPPLELTKTITVNGRLVNSNGQPLANCRINGIVGNACYGWGESDKNGDFVLTDVPEGITLEHYQVWLDYPGQAPIQSTVETKNPLVIRAK